MTSTSGLKKLSSADRAGRLRLIAFTSPHSQAAESYRSLRTSLLAVLRRQSSPSAGHHQLAAVGRQNSDSNQLCNGVGAARGEGPAGGCRSSPTLVASGLQYSAQPGTQRYPRRHLPGRAGHRASRRDAFPGDSAFRNSAGLSRGDACLEKDGRSCLSTGAAEYDHVVLDTPPVSMFTDAVVLGSARRRSPLGRSLVRNHQVCASPYPRLVAPREGKHCRHCAQRSRSTLRARLLSFLPFSQKAQSLTAGHPASRR